MGESDDLFIFTLNFCFTEFFSGQNLCGEVCMAACEVVELLTEVCVCFRLWCIRCFSPQFCGFASEGFCLLTEGR